MRIDVDVARTFIYDDELFSGIAANGWQCPGCCSAGIGEVIQGFVGG